MKIITLRNIFFLFMCLPTSFLFTQNLMPMPASMQFDNGYLKTDSSFSLSLNGKKDQRIEASAVRFLKRLSSQTGIPTRSDVGSRNASAKLQVWWETGQGIVPYLSDDESYSLHVDETGANLRARTFFGVLHGLETFLQLVELGAEGFRVQYVRIEDRPRFPWRGLLIDACRHWMPVEVIKRNLDGMVMVKMNVLHWHLSDDQGFRVESKEFPKLHELGSDGNYYTQRHIKEVIEYAADRGIRVVPEFDMPGHTTSWFVGHPEIASGPGPYQIERKWGVFDPAMDPTSEKTYKFLDTFIGEMANLFPDEYFHIGGDEVTGRQWDANPTIQEFKRNNNLKDNHALQAYFDRRILAILKKHGKKMIGWDEIFHPDLPKDIVVQSWRGQKSLAEGAKQGYQGLLSFGYYLDLIRPASYHYSIDPMDSTIMSLNQDMQKNILGGEACMWAEYVTPENVDSRIWPRNAAIAERLWSPVTFNNLDDMYRRLEITSKRLELLGLTHRTSYAPMLERIAGFNSIEPLKLLADAIEPVKNYERGRTRQYTTLTPLNLLVDAARPESDVARRFSQLTDELLAHRISNENKAMLVGFLKSWNENDFKLQPALAGNQLADDIKPLSKDLSDAAGVGLRLVEILNSGVKLSDDERFRIKQVLENAEKPKAALVLMVVPPIKAIGCDSTMTKTIRYGIVGFGRFADKTIAPAIKQSYNSELVAVQNRTLAKANIVAEIHDVPLAFDSVAELAAHPDIDAVFVISANSLHCDQTIMAARAGKHVLVEKPMAMNVAECERMIEVCLQNNVKLMVGHMLRLSPLLRRIKQFVGSEVLGRIVHAQANFVYDGRVSTRAWLTERRIAGGGPIFDVGIHCLDSLRFILDDEVSSLQGFLHPTPTTEQTETTAHLLLRFSRGTMASILCSYESPVRQSYLEILGAEARISAVDFTVGSQRARLKIEKRSGGALPDVTIEEIEVPNLYVDEVTLFSESILNNTDQSPLTASNALHNQRVLDAAMDLQS